jgi:hypothetical protein
LDKKKLHIDEANDKNYPEPDVPVQDAWEQMKQLLLQAPAAPVSKPGFRPPGKGFARFMVVAGAVATVSLAVYVATGKKEHVTPSQVTYTKDSTPVVNYINKVFEFNNTPFKEAAGYIEKAYGVTIVLKGNFNHCTITTRFDNKPLNEILDILAYTLAFEYTIDEKNRQVTISGDGCN